MPRSRRERVAIEYSMKESVQFRAALLPPPGQNTKSDIELARQCARIDARACGIPACNKARKHGQTEPLLATPAPKLTGDPVSVKFEGIRLAAFINTVFGDIFKVAYDPGLQRAIFPAPAMEERYRVCRNAASSCDPHISFVARPRSIEYSLCGLLVAAHRCLLPREFFGPNP